MNEIRETEERGGEELAANSTRRSLLKVRQREETKARLGTNPRMTQWSTNEIAQDRFRIRLYRFLADQIPIVSACIWTWVRFGAAPWRFEIVGAKSEAVSASALARLNRLADRISYNRIGTTVGMQTLLTDLFTHLFRDGIAGGHVLLKRDGSGVEAFVPVDPADLAVDTAAKFAALRLVDENGVLHPLGSDFRYVALGGGVSDPLGKSILRAVPFVAYIEQQLVDDMRRTSHNSGYHRLHVRVTPPERLAGEGEKGYIERINRYFDDTVSMIKSCEVDENPVTWDNVAIDVLGPDSARSVTNSWFFNHRAMIEEICAGTNLAPFLLGYSYGATTTWSGFKFDMVMRQVRSVQSEVAQLLEWLGNLELALAGYDCRCRFQFDNAFSYRATDEATIQSSRIENLLKLFSAGLIDEPTAKRKAEELLVSTAH